MIVEIVLSYLGNIQFAAKFGIVIFGLGSAFIGLNAAAEEEFGKLRPYLKRWFLGLAGLALVASTPSIDDLWKVRIGLIKLQLASPENVGKGVDTIERIGRKLECKYLGCKDDKEAK